MLKRITKYFLVYLILFFILIIRINGEALNLNSDKYILYNLNDDKILLSKDENKETYIASLTKMMTTIIAI